MKNITQQTLTGEIRRRIPEFEEIYQELVKSYGDELQDRIADRMCGELQLLFVTRYKERATKDNGDLLKRISDLVEDALCSEDRLLHNDVAVSFLETLENFTDDYEGMKAVLGPEARKVLAVFERGIPSK